MFKLFIKPEQYQIVYSLSLYKQYLENLNQSKPKKLTTSNFITVQTRIPRLKIFESVILLNCFKLSTKTNNQKIVPNFLFWKS